MPFRKEREVTMKGSDKKTDQSSLQRGVVAYISGKIITVDFSKAQKQIFPRTPLESLVVLEKSPKANRGKTPTFPD